MPALASNLFGINQPCFGCSPVHPIGFRLRFEQEGEEILTRFTPSDQYQGPPGIMHGGLVMTLADEIAAWAIIGLRGKFGFTVSVQGRLRKAMRIGVEVEGRGWILKETSRLVHSGVKLFQQGEEMFNGEFAFALMDQASAEKLLGGPLPEEWKKFCR